MPIELRNVGPFSYIREPIDRDTLDRLRQDEQLLEANKDRKYVELSDGFGPPLLLSLRIEASKELIRKLAPNINI